MTARSCAAPSWPERRERLAALGAVVIVGGAVAVSQAAHRHASVTDELRLGTTASLRFEPNVGQTDPRVQFLARTPSSAVFLTATEAVMRLSAPPAARSSAGGPMAPPGDTVLRMRPLGANPSAPVEGGGRLEGTSNYLIGGDANRWKTQVPSYGEVRYRGVYPGIDLVYHSSGGGLEYDFVVGPGADPSAITLTFEGQERTALDHGDLILDTAAGRVTQPAPHLYQEAGGSQHAVKGGYRLAGNRVSFSVGGYDPGRPLVIDPVVLYSTFLGGTGWDAASGISVDRAGNAYVVGTTSSVDFPTTAGAVQTSKRSTFVSGSGPPATCTGLDSCRDVVVTKLDPTGSHLVYSTYLGGRSNNGEIDPSLALDASGRAVVGGATDSLPADFPGASTTTLGPLGAINAFVTVLSADGSQAVRTTLFGGGQGLGRAGVNLATAVAAGAGGAVYVTGTTNTTNFPTTQGSFEPVRVCTVCNQSVVFVAKLDGTGQLTYSTYIGHAGGLPLNLSNFTFDAGAGAIAVDRAGDAVIAGSTTAPDYPVTPGAYQALRPDQAAIDAGHAPRNKGFVTKLNPAGSLLLYSTYLGAPFIADPSNLNTQTTGAEEDGLDAVALDPGGDILVSGWSHSPNFPTTAGAFQRVRVCSSAFASACPSSVVSRLHPAGLGPLDLVSSTYLGGTGDGPGAAALPGSADEDDGAHAVALGARGDVFVSGATTSSSFPVTVPHGAPLGPAPGPQNTKVYVTRFDPTLSTLRASATIGGSQREVGRGLALVGSRSYLTGYTTSPDFPITPTAPQASLHGTCVVAGIQSPCPDAFVTSIALPVVTSADALSGPTAVGLGVTLPGQGLAGTPDGGTCPRGSPGCPDHPRDRSTNG